MSPPSTSKIAVFSEFARLLRQQPLAATCCNKSMAQGSQRRSWQCEGPWRPAARPVAGSFSFPRAWSRTNILNKNPVAPHNVRMLSFQQRSRGCQTPVFLPLSCRACTLRELGLLLYRFQGLQTETPRSQTEVLLKSSGTCLERHMARGRCGLGDQPPQIVLSAS